MSELLDDRFTSVPIPTSFKLPDVIIPNFYIFEGPDDAGKSTIISAVAERLRMSDHDKPVFVTREPGGSILGKEALDDLYYGDCGRLGQSLVFLGLMAYHWENQVSPALQSGHTVLVDRHFPSTLVYQGYGDTLPLILSAIERLLDFFGGTPKVIVFDESDRTDDRLAARYRMLAARFGWPVVRLDNLSVEDAARMTLEVLEL